MNYFPTNGPLTLGYVRVSTDRQDLSVEAQQETLRRAGAYKCPDADLELFVDDDTSGAIDFLERPAGARLMKAAQAAIAEGRAVSFMAAKLDRMGRSMIDVDKTCTAFEKLGVRVLLLDVDVDTRTPVGKFSLRIIAAAAELELSRIRERIQTALDHKRANGLVTGTVPYGWNAVETGEVTAKGVRVRRLEPNPEEQKWILHMAGLKARGLSYNKIAADLNRRNVPTKRAGEVINGRLCGSEWQFGHVARILTSKTVLNWLQSEQQLAA